MVRVMKVYIHLIASLALFLLAFTMQIVINYDDVMSRIDKVKFYVMKKQTVNLNEINNYMSDTSTWPTDTCLKSATSTINIIPLLPYTKNATSFTNSDLDAGQLAAYNNYVTTLNYTIIQKNAAITAKNDLAKAANLLTQACVDSRVKVKNSILDKLKCNQHMSQICSYTKRILSGLAFANDTGIYGRALSNSKADIFNGIDKAIDIFRNSYTASQDSSLMMMRSVIYTVFAVSVFSNLLVYILFSLDVLQEYTNIMRYVKALIIGIPIFIGVAYGFSGTGYSMILFTILLPPFLILLWYELLLDHIRHVW